MDHNDAFDEWLNKNKLQSYKQALEEEGQLYLYIVKLLVCIHCNNIVLSMYNKSCNKRRVLSSYLFAYNYILCFLGFDDLKSLTLLCEQEIMELSAGMCTIHAFVHFNTILSSPSLQHEAGASEEI
jgi:hypothetical protein